MQRLPEIQSLVAQTVGILREQIQSGCWERWLPGELELTAQLHVSRVTLRAALRQLEREKWLRAGQGRRREILRRAAAAPVTLASRKLLLVTHTPLARLTSFALYWIEHVRDQVAAAGYDLVVHAAQDIYRPRPERALARLAERERPAGWILYQSTVPMQQWFAARALPVVVAGTRLATLEAASVDIDHRAICRHAAGLLRARGHRHIALLLPSPSSGGDQRSAEGFAQGAQAAGATARIVEHDQTVTGVQRTLELLLGREDPPTGLVVARVPHLLTVLTHLGRQQIRVPQQLALVSRDDDPVLEYLVPAMARYRMDPARYARHLVGALRRQLTGDRPRDVVLTPEFIDGPSLG